MRGSVVAIMLLATALLGGCTLPGDAACDAPTFVRAAQGFFVTLAQPDGGIGISATAAPDARTTAWVLLAAGLVRRTGYEGAFDAAPHVAWLQDQIDTMLIEGGPVDSAANNVSLARAALQVWGRAAEGVPVQDAAYPDVRTLADAWEARYDAAAGRYGQRLNEHLFGAFGAWLFGPADERLDAMARYVAAAPQEPAWADGGDPYAFDVWWTGYARSALGPQPVNVSLALHLEGVLDAHVHPSGGVVGFVSATRPDASSTAAALLGWQAAGEGLADEHVAPALRYLCGLQRADGAVPFSGDQDVARAKTTAEAAIAVALLLQPVPR